MLLPVAIFVAITPAGEAASGWAMVMATDTAFAVGVLALVGRRSSLRLRIFLLTLVIVDDVAAISVIAVVYSTNVQPLALVVGVALLGAMVALRRIGVGTSWVYVALGLGIWLAASAAGVHPTVAGVAVGLLTVAHPPRRATLREATGVTRAFRQQPSPALAAEAARRITMSLSPNERLQHVLHPWTSFVIVPLFRTAPGRRQSSFSCWNDLPAACASSGAICRCPTSIPTQRWRQRQQRQPARRATSGACMIGSSSGRTIWDCPTSSIARGDLAEAQFEKALREGRFSDRVAHDVASAESAGVAETPTFFINDVRYRGAHDLESLEAAIRVALRMTESRAELARDEV